MRGIVILGMLLASISAFAVEEKFTVSHIVAGGYVYYNCDSVEDATEDMLEALGATEINVRCRGGFDNMNPSWSTSARVTANFELPEEGVLTSVELRGRDKCHLATSIYNAVSVHFDVSNEDVSRCSSFRPNSRYKITFDVVK